MIKYIGNDLKRLTTVVLFWKNPVPEKGHLHFLEFLGIDREIIRW